MNFCHQTAIPLQSWVQLIFLIFLSHIFFSLQTINRERKGNPIVSVLFTGLTVGLLFFYGSLNAIAQLCSVLYLLSYSAINASCFFLDAFSAPNFRYFCTSPNKRLCIHPQNETSKIYLVHNSLTGRLSSTSMPTPAWLDSSYPCWQCLPSITNVPWLLCLVVWWVVIWLVNSKFSPCM